MFEALRQWRKVTAERRKTEAALVLSRTAMLDLARLHPTPRVPDDLRGTLESWRIAHYGQGILEAIDEAVPRRRSRPG